MTRSLLIVSTAWVVSCTSVAKEASDDIDRGLYTDAVEKLRQRIQDEPGDEKAVGLLAVASEKGCGEAVANGRRSLESQRLNAAESCCQQALYFEHPCDERDRLHGDVGAAIAGLLETIDALSSSTDCEEAGRAFISLRDVVALADIKSVEEQFRSQQGRILDSILAVELKRIVDPYERLESLLELAQGVAAGATHHEERVALYRAFEEVAERIDASIDEQDWRAALDATEDALPLVKADPLLREALSRFLEEQLSISFRRLADAGGPGKKNCFERVLELDLMANLERLYGKCELEFPGWASSELRRTNGVRREFARMLMDEALLAESLRHAATAGVLASLARAYGDNGPIAARLLERAQRLTALEYSLFLHASAADPSSELQSSTLDELRRKLSAPGVRRIQPVSSPDLEGVAGAMAALLTQAGVRGSEVELYVAHLAERPHVFELVVVDGQETARDADRLNHQECTSKRFDRMVPNPAHAELALENERLGESRRTQEDEELRSRNRHQEALGELEQMESREEAACATLRRVGFALESIGREHASAWQFLQDCGAEQNKWAWYLNTYPGSPYEPTWRNSYDYAVRGVESAGAALREIEQRTLEVDRQCSETQSDLERVRSSMLSAERIVQSTKSAWDLEHSRLRQLEERCATLDRELRQTPARVEQWEEYTFKRYELAIAARAQVNWTLRSIRPPGLWKVDLTEVSCEETDVWTVGVSPDDRCRNVEDPDELGTLEGLVGRVRRDIVVKAAEEIYSVLSDFVPQPASVEASILMDRIEAEDLERICARGVLLSEPGPPEIDPYIERWLLSTDLAPLLAR